MFQPIDEEEAVSLIGEGVHTGLRKGTAAAGSSEAWRAIARSDSGWDDAVRFAIEGLQFMGYQICREERESK